MLLFIPSNKKHMHFFFKWRVSSTFLGYSVCTLFFFFSTRGKLVFTYWTNQSVQLFSSSVWESLSGRLSIYWLLRLWRRAGSINHHLLAQMLCFREVELLVLTNAGRHTKAPITHYLRTTPSPEWNKAHNHEKVDSAVRSRVDPHSL